MSRGHSGDKLWLKIGQFDMIQVLISNFHLMHHRFWAAILSNIIFLTLTVSAVSAQTPNTLLQMDEQLVKFINDYAQVISPSVEAQLENELNAYALQTDHTIVIATTPSLDGKHEQQFANELFSKWKIGRADIDNGLLVLIAPNERTVWIEVGYGLEGVVTDLTAASIARNIMASSFKTGAYDKGTIEGIAAIKQAAEGEFVLPQEAGFFRSDFFIMLSIITAISLIVGGTFIAFVLDNRRRIWPSIVTGGIAGLFDGLTVFVLGGMLAYIILIIAAFTLLAYLLARWLNKIQFDPTKYRTSGSNWTNGRGSSSGSSFSGHSGGSSGGGGGGARW